MKKGKTGEIKEEGKTLKSHAVIKQTELTSRDNMEDIMSIAI